MTSPDKQPWHRWWETDGKTDPAKIAQRNREERANREPLNRAADEARKARREALRRAVAKALPHLTDDEVRALRDATGVLA